ncbi:MAG: flagellar hook-length control protein FliK [Candidatus Tectomicrobia bacterium]|nr:flagellar hook-length control protein FliK [Candidatus Tectomicrobia bacterium]
MDWSRWTDAEGEDAPRQAVQTPAPAAPATAFAGEGDSGQPAEGDGPGGNHLAGKQTVPGQAASDAQSQSKAAPAGAPASQAMDHLVRAEVHRQVMEAALSRMSIAVREGVAQARIQLDPPSLGRMHMELRMQDGAMNAKVTVETSLARDTVMSGLRELKESLLRQGVSLESFSVDVRVNLNAGSFGQDRAANQGDGAFYLEAVPEDETAAQASDRPILASSSLSGDGSINIFA